MPPSPGSRTHRCGLPPFPVILRFSTLLTVLLLPLSVHGQGLEGSLRQLAGANAEGYARPVTHGLGLATIGGYSGGARALPTFGLDLGVRVSAAIPSRDAETFLAVLPGSLSWEHPTYGGTFDDPFRPVGGGSAATPTVTGSGEGVVLEPNGDFLAALLAANEAPENYRIRFPDGMDLSVVPFPVLAATLGIGLGTDVGFSFVPEVEAHPDLGRLRSRGYTLRHEITRWWEGPPLDVSGTFGRQRVEVGNLLVAESRRYGLIMGRTLGPLSVFGLGILRTATVDVDYALENPEANPGLPIDGERIRFRHEVDNGVALGAGVHLSLLVMNLSGDYLWDDYGVVSVKVGFGLR